MLNTSLTLAGIMVLGWLLVYASRRWERAAPRGPLELLGTLRLEGKRAVYLVRVGERVVALGTSEAAMIKLMELSPSDVVGFSKSTEGFGSLLSRAKGEQRRGAAGPLASPSSADAGGTGARAPEGGSQ